MANIDINALSTDVRYVVPPVTSGYDCIPPLPKGELNLMGKLSLDAGLSVDDSGDYFLKQTMVVPMFYICVLLRVEEQEETLVNINTLLSFHMCLHMRITALGVTVKDSKMATTYTR